MFKSTSQLVTVILGIGLIGSNFMALTLLAKKESGIPSIANLPNTPFSSFSMRSTESADGAKEWTLAQRQHDPRTVLTSIDEEVPSFSGKMKKKYTHKESVAQFAIYPQGENGKLTAKQIECIEKSAMAQGNAQMITDTGNTMYVTPALASLPVIGPVVSGLWFGQSRKAATNLGKDIADQWNDC
tara:strand:+ start:55 stop:609 length:555 start_codon:yes stop_codon:yes gene_type:complete